MVDRTRFFHAAGLTITVGSRCYAHGADRTATLTDVVRLPRFYFWMDSGPSNCTFERPRSTFATEAWFPWALLPESSAPDGRPVVSGVQVQAPIA